MMKKFIQPVLCTIGFHNWKVLASIKVSTLSKFVMFKNFRYTNYKYPKINNDFIVKKRECRQCHIIDDELKTTKEYLISEIKRLNK